MKIIKNKKQKNCDRRRENPRKSNNKQLKHAKFSQSSDWLDG